MRIYMYELTVDKRYLSKSTNFGLTPLYNQGEATDGSVPCEFIEETSVTDPTFKISYNHYWKRCNYVWSEDTNRYYYVTDAVLSRGYVYLKCHVDVLNTYKDSIKNKSVIAKRASKWDSMTGRPYNYNKYLSDDKFKAYSASMNRIIEFPDAGFDNNVTEFVMCVVGNTSNNDQGGDE